jgi:hypothetical protein
LYTRLAAIVRNEEKNVDLPEFVNVSQEELDRYYLIWAWWNATGKTHLVSDIMQEPYEAMAVVLEIDRIYEKIVEQLSDDGHNEE